jgi:DNA-binding NarL/FixJ family response regulator
MQAGLRVLIADDHPLFREALRNIVELTFVGVECIDVSDAGQALAAVQGDASFDLILLDLFLPGAEGFSCLISLRNNTPSTPIVVVSASDDVSIVRDAFSYGAMGYLPKSSAREVMKNALRLVMSGSSYVPSEALGEIAALRRVSGEEQAASSESNDWQTLTPRQLGVLALLGEGKANKLIAYELGISEITVKAHVSAILRKLNVSNRLQAVIAAKNITASLSGGVGTMAAHMNKAHS